MHPSARILLYLLSALALPGLSFSGALILLSGLFLISLSTRKLATTAQLIKRTRWLFLLILLGYAYNLPGEAALPWLANLSPSTTGLLTGTQHAINLLSMLLLLDLLVLAMPEDKLLAGIHGMFSKLRFLGLQPERITVRLALTLRALGQRNPKKPSDLFDILRTHTLHDSTGTTNGTTHGTTYRACEEPQETLRLNLTPMRWQDRAALLLASASLGGVWLWKATCV